MIVDKPGMALVGVDPGGTTGIAVWDMWDQKLYVDQIDAGLGRVLTTRRDAGYVVSRTRERIIAARPDKGKGGGAASEMEIAMQCERGASQIICDVVRACGPVGVVCMEDFSLAANPSGVRSSKREGLSPVRVGVRVHTQMELEGHLNGDAWREWTGFSIGGEDRRGMHVKKAGLQTLALPERVEAVRAWVQGEDADEGSLWRGGGWKFRWQMPGSRHWLSDGEKGSVRWLKEREMWVPSLPHGMDALEHLVSFARKIGCEVQGKPERFLERSGIRRNER